MDLSKYRQLYVSETQEILDTLARTLVDLETAPDDRGRMNAAFRLFHSVKGMSGTMGFTPVFDMAHQLEELMDHVLSGRLALGAEVVDLLLAGVDRLGLWVADVETGSPPAIDSTAQSLHARIVSALARSGEPPPPEAPSAGELNHQAGDLVIQARLIEVPNNPGIRGYLLRRQLGALGEVVDTLPDADSLRAGRLNGAVQIALRTVHPQKVVRRFIEVLGEWTEISVGDGAAASTLEHDLFFTGELDASLSGPPRAEPAAIVHPPQETRTVRVRVEWLDQLAERIDAMATLTAGLDHEGHPASTLAELRRLLGELTGEARSVRRVPLSMITDRLHRAVRDLARTANKRAVLKVEGADQPLDRSIIEGIDPALTHLVRNAVEHGIESPEERHAAGKAGIGLVALRCRRVRDEIMIELADDGAGIDPDSLVDRAVTLGLLERDEAHRLARRDLALLLSLPGLTTREEAGAGAGRGMGVDAILESITALGGTVQVRTQKDRGTLFRLRLPVSGGRVRLLQVDVGGHRFAVPKARLEAVLSPVALREDDGQRWLDYEEQRWRGVDVDQALRIGATRPSGFGLLVRDPRRVFLVDDALEVGSAVIQPLPAPLERVRGLLGVWLQPDGPPIFVIDPSSSVFLSLGSIDAG